MKTLKTNHPLLSAFSARRIFTTLALFPALLAAARNPQVNHPIPFLTSNHECGKSRMGKKTGCLTAAISVNPDSALKDTALAAGGMHSDRHSVRTAAAPKATPLQVKITGPGRLVVNSSAVYKYRLQAPNGRLIARGELQKGDNDIAFTDVKCGVLLLNYKGESGSGRHCITQ